MDEIDCRRGFLVVESFGLDNARRGAGGFRRQERRCDAASECAGCPVVTCRFEMAWEKHTGVASSSNPAKAMAIRGHVSAAIPAQSPVSAATMILVLIVQADNARAACAIGNCSSL